MMLPTHFYRTAQGRRVSTLGLGTYLGGADDETDSRYTEAVRAAVAGGINVIDTAINYRHQRSERSIGSALRGLERSGLLVCTKAGFLTPGAVPEGVLRDGDVVGRMHSMAPDFLADQIDRSRANLGMDTIDVFYLHNPETQLGFVSRDEFHARIGAAFARLEQLVAAGKIGWYGTATWDGYRKAGKLDLNTLLEIANREGGPEHHFRFIQIPFNLGMVESFVSQPGRPGVLEISAAAGVTAIASATLMQASLTSDMPEGVIERLPGLATNAQRAIQFTRSTPGIAVALVGMSGAAHVVENLGIAQVPPLTRDEYMRLYQ